MSLFKLYSELLIDARCLWALIFLMSIHGSSDLEASAIWNSNFHHGPGGEPRPAFQLHIPLSPSSRSTTTTILYFTMHYNLHILPSPTTLCDMIRLHSRLIAAPCQEGKMARQATGTESWPFVEERTIL